MKVDANVVIRFTELLISGFRFRFFPREKVGSGGLTDTHTGLRVAWGAPLLRVLCEIIHGKEVGQLKLDVYCYCVASTLYDGLQTPSVRWMTTYSEGGRTGSASVSSVNDQTSK
jgi:hypothetical protein